MISKENDFFVQGEDFFVGKPIDYLWANGALNFALHMVNSGNGLPCDRTVLELAEKGSFGQSEIRQYLRFRGIIVREIRINAGGDMEFNITQLRAPLSRPEPDF